MGARERGRTGAAGRRLVPLEEGPFDPSISSFLRLSAASADEKFLGFGDTKRFSLKRQGRGSGFQFTQQSSHCGFITTRVNTPCLCFLENLGSCILLFFGGSFFLRYVGLSLLWPLPLRSTGSGRTGSAAMAHGPSRTVACGIFPDRGTNPCPLHRQADSQPLCHQGSPSTFLISSVCKVKLSYLSENLLYSNAILSSSLKLHISHSFAFRF